MFDTPGGWEEAWADYLDVEDLRALLFPGPEVPLVQWAGFREIAIAATKQDGS